MRSLIAAQLDDARRRTLDLLEPFDDAALSRQVSPLMSPLVWDLAHIGHYEELWLLRNLTGAPATDPHFDDVYDAFKHPRRDRPALRILDPHGARAYLVAVRERVLDGLTRADLDGNRDGIDPLLEHGFVYGMVVQHEHQHDETMLATIQLMESPVPGGALARADALDDRVPSAPTGGDDTSAVAAAGAEVSLPGGRFVMGTDAEPWAYDNERPAYEVEIAPFRIDRAPVTNAAFLAFIVDGGYDDPRFWTEAGWKWRMEADLAHPQFWHAHGSSDWSVLRFGRHLDLVTIVTQPVQHVCWYEADAFARWAGKRLPTETEWEYAASWGPDAAKRRYPWGDTDPDDSQANLGQTRYGPVATGTRPDGASAWGIEQMVGDVWEWTASDFSPYPGFRSFPYREYSEVFFPEANPEYPVPPSEYPVPASEYKVLRGGSWATHPSAVRTTFRNWDYPIRRQIFSGFRCARDA